LTPQETGTLIAATENMTRSLEVVVAICCTTLAASAFESVSARAQRETGYRIEARVGRVESLRARFSDAQLGLLEKLNRADLEHLAQLPEIVVPVSWGEDELSYSVLPLQYSSSEAWPTFLVVYLPGQVFGAYEFGDLVRWGPVSTGGRNSPTSAGRFALNWRSTGRASTVDPEWFMRWYFNFGNREGLAFHEYSLPGYPASHGCIRLLERDARWLFGWHWVVTEFGAANLFGLTLRQRGEALIGLAHQSGAEPAVPSGDQHGTDGRRTHAVAGRSTLQ
jgi:hypothetical protein